MYNTELCHLIGNAKSGFESKHKLNSEIIRDVGHCKSLYISSCYSIKLKTNKTVNYVKEIVVIFKPEFIFKCEGASIHLTNVLQLCCPPAHMHLKFHSCYCAAMSIFTSEWSCSNQLLSYNEQE